MSAVGIFRRKCSLTDIRHQQTVMTCSGASSFQSTQLLARVSLYELNRDKRRTNYSAEDRLRTSEQEGVGMRKKGPTRRSDGREGRCSRQLVGMKFKWIRVNKTHEHEKRSFNRPHHVIRHDVEQGT